MGGAQSSTADSAPRAAELKTSYYELLAVDRNATDDEIKKAYRRKALELHPDRNYGNVEDATRLFAEVQSAYEVLSDPQERAWYDSHESAILRGEDGVGEDGAGEVYEGNIKVTTADDIARMVRKFNSNVSFTDAPSGFFGYLRETFEHLVKEEQVAAQWENVDIPDYPSFGHKEDDYEDVVKPFYTVWSGFATRKTFKWMDKYRLSEAPDRRYRRAMEKENQKLREEGIREFNDAVRSLVAFVRKRDPRYIPTQQSEAERQKVLRDAAQAQAARARKENEERLKGAVPEWAQIVQKDELEGEIEESESDEEHFECVACRKTFKSEKQWEAHEKSKKHQKAVQALRKKMQKENKHLDLDEDLDTGASSPPVEPAAEEITDEDVEPAVSDEALPEKVNGIHLEEEASINGEDDAYDETVSSHPPQDDDEQSSVPNLDSANSTPSAPQPKQGKAAQKRAKKAAAAAAASEVENKFSCASCAAAFPSKTRLFQHIKDFGHAAPKPASGGGGGKGKKGKR
ncbi:DnaJ-domain-containing protein [Myriangium duriaei CBS 260.36]|uniref:DnaJ-domain-containing protein n=1 Tax=Myriangium duriaei CBS 260.36 TaxID=1168546 RepID=A0A9P4MKK3_9PEZI|nr:DnaJ-domain-containing protein [Myriangium duriaei CBS 260.36]